MAPMYPSNQGHQLWSRLLPREVSDYIVSLLPPQDVACNLRLSCKHAASCICTSETHKTASLSQPVPGELFVACWGSADAVSKLPWDKRPKLLNLTAATGELDNVKALVDSAHLAPTADTLAAAAAAGHLPMCKWLHQHRCPMWRSRFEPDPLHPITPLQNFQNNHLDKGGVPAMRAAAGAGQLDICKWLSAVRCPSEPIQLMRWGAAGGHIPVCEWALSLGFRWEEEEYGGAYYSDSDEGRNHVREYDSDAEERREEEAAAGFHEAVVGGHRALCEFMLQRGCRVPPAAPALALSGGHVALCDWLMQLYDSDSSRYHVDWLRLPCGAALGADLATLQRVVTRVLGVLGGTWRAGFWEPRLACAAVSSATPDAAAKLRWLQREVGLDFGSYFVYDTAVRLAGDMGRSDTVGVLVDILGQAEEREAAAVAAAAATASASASVAGGSAGLGSQPQAAGAKVEAEADGEGEPGAKAEEIPADRAARDANAGVGPGGNRQEQQQGMEQEQQQQRVHAGMTVQEVRGKYAQIKDVLAKAAARNDRVDVLRMLEATGWTPHIVVVAAMERSRTAEAVAWRDRWCGPRC